MAKTVRQVDMAYKPGLTQDIVKVGKILAVETDPRRVEALQKLIIILEGWREWILTQRNGRS